MTEDILQAIDRVAEHSPDEGNMLSILRSVILQGRTLEEARTLVVNVMGGGQRARAAVRLVEAELNAADRTDAITAGRRFCNGSGRPAIGRRTRAVLPEMRCYSCRRWLVVPLGGRDDVPQHIFMGRASDDAA